jgi:predicted MFS family arabinose efflux permease
LLAVGMLMVVVPLMLLTLGGTRAVGGVRPGGGGGHIQIASRAQALGSLRFWSIAAPFALALMAQVGFIVHQVAFLLPKLGPGGVGVAISAASAAAMLGRLGLGVIIDRLDNRRASAITFLVQVAALLLMLAMPDRPAALYVGCIGFGLSVGNVITLPSLITQREFSASSFGLIVGLSTAIGQVAYSFSPSLFGVVHDLAGGYAPVLMLCTVFDTVAAVLVLRPGKPL